MDVLPCNMTHATFDNMTGLCHTACAQNGQQEAFN